MSSNKFLKSALIFTSTLLIYGVCLSNVDAAQLINASGKVTLLRIHAGGGYGPPQDFIDGEVVIKLDTKPGMAFGMQLRNNNERPVREGMLSLLREAFKSGWKVSIDYWIDTGKKNGIIHRVWVSK